MTEQKATEIKNAINAANYRYGATVVKRENNRYGIESRVMELGRYHIDQLYGIIGNSCLSIAPLGTARMLVTIY